MGVFEIEIAELRDEGNHNSRARVSSAQSVVWQLKRLSCVPKTEVFVNIAPLLQSKDQISLRVISILKDKFMRDRMMRDDFAASSQPQFKVPFKRSADSLDWIPKGID